MHEHTDKIYESLPTGVSLESININNIGRYPADKNIR